MPRNPAAILGALGDFEQDVALVGTLDPELTEAVVNGQARLPLAPKTLPFARTHRH